MDNFLYILLGIAWVGYSIYTARQKAIKKQNGGGVPVFPPESSPLPIPGNTGTGHSVLEDILRELQGTKTAPIPAPVSTNQPFDNAPEYSNIPASEYIPVEVKNAETEYQKRHSKETKEAVHSYVNDEQAMKNVNFAERFNLRDAIIFSELLNRKYF